MCDPCDLILYFSFIQILVEAFIIILLTKGIALQKSEKLVVYLRHWAVPGLFLISLQNLRWAPHCT